MAVHGIEVIGMLHDDHPPRVREISVDHFTRRYRIDRRAGRVLGQRIPVLTRMPPASSEPGVLAGKSMSDAKADPWHLARPANWRTSPVWPGALALNLTVDSLHHCPSQGHDQHGTAG